MNNQEMTPREALQFLTDAADDAITAPDADNAAKATELRKAINIIAVAAGIKPSLIATDRIDTYRYADRELDDDSDINY